MYFKPSRIYFVTAPSGISQAQKLAFLNNFLRCLCTLRQVIFNHVMNRNIVFYHWVNEAFKTKHIFVWGGLCAILCASTCRFLHGFKAFLTLLSLVNTWGHLRLCWHVFAVVVSCLGGVGEYGTSERKCGWRAAGQSRVCPRHLYQNTERLGRLISPAKRIFR